MQQPHKQKQNEDLVSIQKKTATLDQLIVNYNQLYKTYLQLVEAEVGKQQQRKYPYTIKNPNEFGNSLTPVVPFPSNGTEDACFKSCIDSGDCVYALYSNSGCGIDCNPNKCLLYGEKAGGIIPVTGNVVSSTPPCPVSGDSTGTDAWCKAFNNPVSNAIIPALVLRTGGTDWRSLAVQMPKSTANAADAPMTVDMTTNLQTWGPDTQFSDVNYAPSNEISLQFRFFAEYWLNAYGVQNGSAPVITTNGVIGTYTFSKLTPVGDTSSASSSSSSYAGTFVDIYGNPPKSMIWNSAEPPSGGAAAGQQTAAALASNSESAKFNYSYSAFEKPVWKTTQNMNAMKGQLPPQLAQQSVPSWQFLGVQDSAQACQAAANNDPDHVYGMATYYNASYNSPGNGNDAFARSCYGHVAGAPAATVSSVQEDNVQTMTPPYGYTKLGGKNGIAILKKMYQLNKQIMALTDALKITSPPSPTVGKKEAFTQKTDGDKGGTNEADDEADDEEGDETDMQTRLSKLAKKLKTDEAKLNKTLHDHSQLDTDEIKSQQLLLYSRIKFGVAVVLGLFMAYLAYRFLTSDNELIETINTEVGANANANANPNMYADMDPTS
jgi:hypothetical protein